MINTSKKIISFSFNYWPKNLLKPRTIHFKCHGIKIQTINAAVNDIFSWKSTCFFVADGDKLLLLWIAVNNNELFCFICSLAEKQVFFCVFRIWGLCFSFDFLIFLIGVQASLFYGLHIIKPYTNYHHWVYKIYHVHVIVQFGMGDN